MKISQTRGETIDWLQNEFISCDTWQKLLDANHAGHPNILLLALYPFCYLKMFTHSITTLKYLKKKKNQLLQLITTVINNYMLQISNFEKNGMKQDGHDNWMQLLDQLKLN